MPSNIKANGTDTDDIFLLRQYTTLDPPKEFSGGLWAWGFNGSGELGFNDRTHRSSPVQVGALTTWKYATTTASRSFFIKDDTTLWAVGSNGAGNLGVGTTISAYSSPIQVGSLTNWKIITHADSSIGLRTSSSTSKTGTLWTWGTDYISPFAGWTGSMGLNDNPSTAGLSTPVQIGALTDWSWVSGGYRATAAIRSGRLWTWGDNSDSRNMNSGHLGYNAYGKVSSPVQVGSLTDWKYVQMGNQAWYAIKNDNTLWVCGQVGLNGQLGLNENDSTGFTTKYSSPVQLGSLNNWKQVSGSGSIAAVKTDGTLWVWGGNAYGQLGLGNITPISSPVQVGALTNWSRVWMGIYTYALKTDGTLWAWGYNTTGYLGLGDETHRSSPVQVGGLTTWKHVAPASFAIRAVI